MNPNTASVSDLIPHARRVDSEALAKFVAVFSPADHSHEEAGEHEQHGNGKDEVVEKANRTDHFLAR
jgi:hypothetical protein